MLREEVIQVWASLKEKLTTRLHSTLIKPFTAPLLFEVLSDSELATLKERLTEKANFLTSLDNRRTNQLLSRADQARYDQVKEEVRGLKATLTEQTEWRREEILASRLNAFRLSEAQGEANQTKQELVLANEKVDQLTDKLNWLRTLVRNRDLEQLLALVRGGRI